MTDHPKNKKPSYVDFEITNYQWKPDIDYRKHPTQYKVGKGEQGVLICEPYKSEIGPFWRFKNPEVAIKSAEKIYQLFLSYLSNDDFVGADLSRKYLQMGYTRARRYANYKGGKKYDKDNDFALLERGTGEEMKAEAAAIFYDYWKRAENQPDYQQQKLAWKEKYG
ncbi:DUF4385 domain-containing protein [Pedobacter sp. Leaf250]|uniref:DUF4385 domain-containing protein n=1 Tax=Pedobacter sp. Leaf250 TaxID=2876559 RepID=UPI001E5091D4|nr:DUF4385 domain-containing protein [Pedobacter sp. Leaf250]